MCAAHLTQRDGYQATTQGQLKEQLYQEIIHYFDKGKVKKIRDRCPVVLFLSGFPVLRMRFSYVMFVESGVCYKLCIGRFYACSFRWDF